MIKHEKNIRRAWMLAFAIVVLVACLSLGACSPKQPAAEPTTTVTTEPPVSTTTTTAPPETTVPPETTQPPETTTPPETTVLPTTEPPVTTEPPETTVPSTTEPEETWIPTEPPVTDPPETEPPVTEPKPTEPEVTFKEVNETVYTSNKVGLHKGPGFDYKELLSVDEGTELLRTGIGENGWSRVTYGEKTYFVRTSFLSKSKPEPEPEPTDPPEPTNDPGYAGNGKYYCPHCGKISGDGSNGTCLRYFMTGFDCPCCGVYVPAQVCHTCGKDD